MEVICSHCDKKLLVPDDKIPRDQTVRINCPKCRNKIIIDAQKSSLKESPPDEPVAETGDQHTRSVESKQDDDGGEEVISDYNGYTSDEALIFFSEDAKLALLLVDDDMVKKIKQPIEELGFKAVLSSNTRNALEKLRFHHFDLILLNEGFDGQDLGSNPIMNYLNHMSMSSRRRIFLTLISNKFNTMDNMMAYAMSANLIINRKDMAKISAVLKKGLTDHEKFYKIFMDSLIEVGKA